MRVWKDDEKKLEQLINVLRDPMIKTKGMEMYTHDFVEVEVEYVLSGLGVQQVNGVEYLVKIW